MQQHAQVNTFCIQPSLYHVPGYGNASNRNWWFDDWHDTWGTAHFGSPPGAASEQ